jgi:hypothetical protein
MRLIIAILLIIITNQLAGQDTIVLHQGKQKQGVDIIKIENGYIHYQYTKDKERQKVRSIASHKVFAIYTPLGKEVITFLPDTTDQDLSVVDMLSFTDGLAAGYSMTKYPIAFTAGLLISASSGAFLPMPVNFLVPVLYPAVVGMTPIHNNKFQVIPQNKSDNELFLSGFENAGRQKRTKSAVVGSVGGFVSGLLVQMYFFP